MDSGKYPSRAWRMYPLLRERAREKRADVTCVAQSNVALSQGPFLQLRISCTSIMSQTAKEVDEEKQSYSISFDVVQSGEQYD